ncbi:hypothetical protein DS2_02438 [Catenovulum agarivorans DS-2]|uniref:Uncharacterized protein n=1 Tax=Catenovulum agarivorans DS-2 TaxID=1328313 RepID=W7R2Y3_9ALTE|nr:hypothetical protein [Catenovulum agarivorans]EWH12005.1 hypothetical protein DS2_02438 [Catenovulum agarivorans DS-2]
MIFKKIEKKLTGWQAVLLIISPVFLLVSSIWIYAGYQLDEDMKVVNTVKGELVYYRDPTGKGTSTYVYLHIRRFDSGELLKLTAYIKPKLKQLLQQYKGPIKANVFGPLDGRFVLVSHAHTRDFYTITTEHEDYRKQQEIICAFHPKYISQEIPRCTSDLRPFLNQANYAR